MADLLSDSLAQVQDAIRQNPVDDKLRIHLFQLYAQAGLWQKALGQLQVAAQLNAMHKLLAYTYRLALRAELLRANVFRGTCSPQVLGKPPQWIGFIIEAMREDRLGNLDAAAQLRNTALEAAQPIPGRVDEKPFEWIADADGRIGPAMEVFTNGEYYWLPFESITEIRVSAPEDLRDLIWLPAHIKLVNEGLHPMLLPVRYPFSDEMQGTGNDHLLSQLTSWSQRKNGEWVGHGVKIFTTNTDDYSILDIRHIHLDAAVSSGA